MENIINAALKNALLKVGKKYESSHHAVAIYLKLDDAGNLVCSAGKIGKPEEITLTWLIGFFNAAIAKQKLKTVLLKQEQELKSTRGMIDIMITVPKDDILIVVRSKGFLVKQLFVKDLI